MDEAYLEKYPELERRHFWWAVRRKFFKRLASSNTVSSNDRRVRILDVGCGAGLLASELATAGAEVVGVDTSLVKHSSDREGLTFLTRDFLDLPGELEPFDLVFALDVIEHTPDESEAVRALRRLAQPGGGLVISVPAYEWLWSNHDVINGHFRRYTASGLRECLESQGFHVQRCGYIFSSLLPFKMLQSGLEKVGIENDSGASIPNPLLNRSALRYFSVECAVAAMRRNFLPFGTSVVAVAQAQDQ